MLLALQLNNLLGDAPTLVEIPNVVGQSQASGTTELEGEGFVVAVQSAYSNAVAAGNIISQSPGAGTLYPAGGTVTITVSLGEEPVSSSGGGWYIAYELELARRRQERKRREELEEESERIEEETSREIARLLREQEAKEARRADLQRLSALVARYAGRADTAELGQRVQKALSTAASKKTNWSLFSLERELQREREEETFLLNALRIALDD